MDAALPSPKLMKARNKTDDLQWMSEAITLARRGQGRTRPNPPVGAVIVKNGRIIGSGWHRKAGSAHAEINAIKAAGAAARNASIYVTLEPCSTQGRTGACTDAIIELGISRVVVASTDPNPKHRGRGFSTLRKAGIEVVRGVGVKQADELIAPFAKWISSGTPYLTLKMAMSLDGRITDSRGKSQWISCEQSRKAVRKLRGRVDAVMVGSGTVLADNPSLYPVSAGSFQPYRVAVDSRGRTPLKSNLLSDDQVEKTIIVVGSSCSIAREKRIIAAGAKVVRTKGAGGRVSLRDMMAKLGKLGILHVLCEGGAVLAGSLIEKGVPDEYHIYSAPIILGDSGCLPVIAGQAWSLSNAPQVEIIETSRSGQDILVRARQRRK